MSDSGAGRPYTIQAHITGLMTEDPTRTWTPTQMWGALHGYGYSHSLDHVTVAMTRLLERGVIERVRWGVYALAEQQPEIKAGYSPCEVPGAVTCSRCHAMVVDDEAAQAEHTRFHNTWTR